MRPEVISHGDALRGGPVHRWECERCGDWFASISPELANQEADFHVRTCRPAPVDLLKHRKVSAHVTLSKEMLGDPAAYVAYVREVGRPEQQVCLQIQAWAWKHLRALVNPAEIKVEKSDSFLFTENLVGWYGHWRENGPTGYARCATCGLRPNNHSGHPYEPEK